MNAVTIAMFNGRLEFSCCLLSTYYSVSVPQVCYDLPATETKLAQSLQPHPYVIHYLTAQVLGLSGEIRPSDLDQHF